MQAASEPDRLFFSLRGSGQALYVGLAEDAYVVTSEPYGLVEETRALIETGRGEALRALRAIGYDEAIDLIEGRLDRAGAETRVNLRTAQLAKRQRTWFRHQEPGLALAAEGLEPEALERVALERLRGAGVAIGSPRPASGPGLTGGDLTH